ncbi:hypothetical protein [Caudoviricetes sp.]|nr:hypothetical protein [Caudoviricetes sp.]
MLAPMTAKVSVASLAAPTAFTAFHGWPSGERIVCTTVVAVLA